MLAPALLVLLGGALGAAVTRIIQRRRIRPHLANLDRPYSSKLTREAARAIDRAL